MRFYLIDRILELKTGDSITGIKAWSISEDIFEDHFPGFPIVPGVLLIESMAQLLGILIEKTFTERFKDDPHGIYAVLSIVHKAKFKKFLIPGDTAYMEGSLKSLENACASGIVKLKTENQYVAEAELSFMLISKKDLPNERLRILRDEYYNIIINAHSKRNQTTR